MPMSNRYWFKPKPYGFGFVPITWEGWLASLAFLGLVLLSVWVHNIGTDHPSTKDVIGFLFDVVVLTVSVTLLFDKKTKEDLKWRWGGR